jgi:glutathione synthase
MTTPIIGVLMDPIQSITPYKDSTLAMLLAIQRKGWQIAYLTLPDVYLRDGQVRARVRGLEVRDDSEGWFSFPDQPRDVGLAELDVLLMRKDPPFDMEYIYATYLLEVAESAGLLVVNRPRALRDFNEKLATAWFPQCTPATLVTRDGQRLREFVASHGASVLKPLDGMGGASIFKVLPGDPNIGSLIEMMTNLGRRTVMIQQFIPEIAAGDKRVLLVDGEPIPYALARVPAEGEFRGNLAVGATGHGVALGARERWICEQVGPRLKQAGLLFVGLDVIGDYLTEINVTSPTGIRELDKTFELDIAGQLMDAIATRLPTAD